MKKIKISLIGSGNIGSTLAHLILLKNLGDIVLLNRTANKAKGKALDLLQSSYISKNDVSIIGTDDYKKIKDSDVIIVTSGEVRKEGMSREDLIEINTKIIKEIGQNIKKYSPNSFVICVTNPLDVMVWVLQQTSEIPTNKIVGMAGVLDSARFSFFLSQKLNVSISDIQALVLGSHGDTMLPALNYVSVSGIPINDFVKTGKITQEDIKEIISKTKKGGGEIVSLLGNGSAYYAPASSVIAMVESYIFNQKRLLPCTSFVNGKYNVNGLFIGVPSIIGENGIEEIIEVKLSQEEQEDFNISVESIKSLVKIAEKYL